MRSIRSSFSLLLGTASLLSLTLVGCGGQGAAQPSSEDTHVIESESTTPAAEESGEPETAQGSEMTEREQDLAQREAELSARERQLDSRTTAPRHETSATHREPAASTRPAVQHYQRPEPVMETVWVDIPAATALAVEFMDSLSSETSVVGDSFRARVVEDVLSEGVVAIPKGSEVAGTVSEVVGSKKIGGQAKLALNFDRLQLPSGESHAIQASFAEQAKSDTGRDAATIGGAAAGGAVLGRLLKKHDKGKGTILGAVVGAAVGTAVAASKPGEPVTITSGMVAGLHLDQPLQVAVKRASGDEKFARQ